MLYLGAVVTGAGALIGYRKEGSLRKAYGQGFQQDPLRMPRNPTLSMQAAIKTANLARKIPCGIVGTVAGAITAVPTVGWYLGSSLYAEADCVEKRREFA